MSKTLSWLSDMDKLSNLLLEKDILPIYYWKWDSRPPLRPPDIYIYQQSDDVLVTTYVEPPVSIQMAQSHIISLTTLHRHHRAPHLLWTATICLLIPWVWIEQWTKQTQMHSKVENIYECTNMSILNKNKYTCSIK